MGLTYGPQPAWRDLIAGFLGAVADDRSLAAPWTGGRSEARWYGRSAWALADTVADWRRRHGEQMPSFWVPSYFCDNSLQPARLAGIDVVHYELGEDLNPDWPALRRAAEQGRPDIFILVHYFGHPADGAQARRFADDTGALLVEDCAHVLRPEADIGAHGDVVFFSPHKFLPVPCGAVMTAPAISEAPPRRTQSVTPWAVKRAVQKILPGPLQRSRTRRQTLAFDEDPAVAPAAAGGPGAYAKRAIGAEMRNAESIGARRRANAAIYRRWLENANDAKPFFDTSAAEGAAPYRFVARCPDHAGAVKLYGELRRKGLPAESWPDLAREVAAEPDRFPLANRWRQTLLMLPVHQSIDADELERLLRAP
ncbi:MAG: DegT/DnrJ/EryC1/StrS family aminotransferase [Magnetovibrio sp.]|nr:DegT/DnrJ/EryC1/StrS family aminotransferase [Magnetovibrio sp.]